ncbi:hypothetical protein ACJJTC_019872 [Scirpophaga incertulas]
MVEIPTCAVIAVGLLPMRTMPASRQLQLEHVERRMVCVHGYRNGAPSRRTLTLSFLRIPYLKLNPNSVQSIVAIDEYNVRKSALLKFQPVGEAVDRCANEPAPRRRCSSPRRAADGMRPRVRAAPPPGAP